MRVSVLVGVGSATAAMVGGIALGGCSGNTSTASPPPAGSGSVPTGPPSPSTDYSALLIKASDITQPADFFTSAPPTGFTSGAPAPRPNGQPGVAALFKSLDSSRQISDTIVVLADESAAKSAVEAAVAGIGSAISIPTPQPLPVGHNGTMVSGTSTDGSRTATVAMFTEGKAFVTLEFDGAPNDPVNVDFVNDVGQKQDAAIRNSLPG